MNVDTNFLSKATLDAGKDNNGRPTTIYDNVGKYFDQFEFNKNFEKYIKTVDNEILLNEKINTNDLNTLENAKINPYDLPVSEILINTKNTWINIVKNKQSNDKFFYVALTFIIIAIMYIILAYIFK